MPEKKIKIAVDGYSSCGKSTLAKQLAAKLGYLYIDSGAMYRAVTLFAIQNRIIRNDFFDKKGLINRLGDIVIDFKIDNNNRHLTYLNNKNVENEIRKLKVSSFVSQISTIREVRQQMVVLQRKLSENHGVVMDGRDIGTVVFPKADLKLFVTADVEIRAKRRFDELKLKNPDIDIESVKQNLMQRDFLDKSRSESPLRQAEDAILIDNSNLSREEQLQIALEYVYQIINAS